MSPARLPIPPSRHQSGDFSRSKRFILTAVYYIIRRNNFSSKMTNNPNNSQNQRQAAEDLIRQRLDNLYGVNTEPAQTNESTPQSIPDSQHQASQSEASDQQLTSQSTADNSNPYRQTYHSQQTPKADWQAYHSAWQNYYQQYYAAYYSQQLQKYQTSTKTKTAANTSEVINPKDEALSDLRSKLRTNMMAQAKKVRKSRHFWPLALAFTTMLVFIFLQYNKLIIGQIQTYITPGRNVGSTIVVDPTINIGVGPEPRLIIPSINVNVPVVYGIGNDHQSQQNAMRDGVAHFAVPGASSLPGQIGNTPISGHSSSDVFDQGNYKFIFAQLDRLNSGDVIYADYQSVRYTYSVTKKEVVWPNEWQKLVYPTDKPLITLITCTPVGTDRQRLLVTAEQISPDPSQAPKPSVPSVKIEKRDMPGNGPSLLERLFGAR